MASSSRSAAPRRNPVGGLAPTTALGARRLPLAAAAVVVMFAAACGGTATSSRPPATRPSTTTTVPRTGGTTLPTGGCTTPTLAVQAVVAAWMASDRGAAGQCATPDAVATLFAHPAHGAGWTFQGCDGPDPGVPVCTFTYPGGVSRLSLHGTEAAGWSVDHVQLGAA